MDLQVLQQIAQELNETLPGGFINKIHQPLPRDLVIRVRIPGSGEKKLMISADPQRGRIHLTDLKMPNPPSPPWFCAYLRAHLNGARIVEIACAEDDRVVTITTLYGKPDQPSQRDLILELLGRDSNILLVDRDSNTIMECIHRIPYKEAGSRVVLPGEKYSPPPKREHGPVGLDTITESGELNPGITAGPKGKRVLTVRAIVGQDEVFESMNPAADRLYSRVLGSDLLESFRKAIAGPLKKRIKALERRITNIEADRKRLEKFRARQEEGELLKGNLHLVEKGMSSVDVQDWTTGETRTIRLDPALDPVANMSRIFKKAAKGKRGDEILPSRMEKTLEEKRALQDLLFFVEQAQDMDELNRLAQELPQGIGFAGKNEQTRNSKNHEKSATLFREFVTPSGATAFVGKSGKGNDQLLRTKAQKGDLWFHVKDAAGAHVLLPQRTGKPSSQQDVEFAAGLAVRFSKARDKGKTEVIMADVKDISRIKGALPGQVKVRKFETIIADGSEESEEP
jgi:predicted ribosome quality control (RQC) complex YloA/Tae2 family protein